MSLLRWVTWPSADLRAAGEDPLLRKAHTGHPRLIQEPWALTIGQWAACSTSEILQGLQVDRSTYNNFKGGHHLKTRRKFLQAASMQPHELLLARTCYSLTRRYYERYRDLPFGELCRKAALRVGVLPIECVVHTTQYAEFLATLGSTYEELTPLSPREHDELWHSHGNEALQFDAIFKRPFSRHEVFI